MALMRVYCGLAASDPPASAADVGSWLTAAVVDDAGRLLDVCEMGDDPIGYAELGALLAERSAGSGGVAVAADSDEHEITLLLAAAGRPLAIVDDETLDDYADRFADDDSSEEIEAGPAERRAVGLARALQAGALAAASQAAPRELLAYKPVLAAHAAMAAGRQGTAVALREVLRELYPAALRAYPDPAEAIPLAILDALPEPGLLGTTTANRGRDAAVAVELANAGVADQNTITDAITALRVAIAETPRRTGIGKAPTTAVAETIRQAVAAVRACDQAIDALVGLLSTKPAGKGRPALTPPPLRAVGAPDAAAKPATRRGRTATPAPAPEPVAPAARPRAGTRPATRPTTRAAAETAAEAPGTPTQPTSPAGPLTAWPGGGFQTPPPMWPEPAGGYPPSGQYQQVNGYPTAGGGYPVAGYPTAPDAYQSGGHQRPGYHPAAGYPSAGYPQAGSPAAQAGHGPADYPQAGPPPGGYPPAGYPSGAFPPAAALPPGALPNNGLYPDDAAFPLATDVPPPVSRDSWPLQPAETDDRARTGYNDASIPRQRVAPPWQADDLSVPTEPPALRLVESPADGRHEPPRFDPPRFDPPRYEESRSEPSRSEPSRSEQPRSEQPRYEPSRFESSRFESSRYEEPRYEEPRYEEPRFESTRYEPSRLEEPRFDYASTRYDEPPRYSGDSFEAPRYAAPSEPDGDLLIFAQARSAWFVGQPDEGGIVPSFSEVADQGWHAAARASHPQIGDETSVGLPRRVPQANLVPGSPLPPADDRGLRIVRDAAALAAHTTGYFRGSRRGEEVRGYAVGGRPGRESGGGWDFSRDGWESDQETGYRSAARR